MIIALALLIGILAGPGYGLAFFAGALAWGWRSARRWNRTWSRTAEALARQRR